MTSSDRRAEQERSLAALADRLAEEFRGTFDTATTERFLRSCYKTLEARAKLQDFLPLLAWRFARERLYALARAEHGEHDGKPAVLFMCVHNSGRSQMAMGFFQRLAGGRAVVWSGGSEPGEQVNPAAVAAMREVGIDISHEYPKPWTGEIVRAADAVVTMGCGDVCPTYPGKRYEDWEVDDPAAQGIEAVRPIRDEIERRVRRLLSDLGVPALEEFPSRAREH